MKSREFQIFVKPVGAACNLRCSYCYYLKKKNLYPKASTFLMSDDILEKYIIQHIEASTEQVIIFSWHGGEPTLAGIDFFRRAIKFQKKYKPAGRTIINGIQTNGTLLNDEWCSFLADENFSVGISIDGPGELHNKHRRISKKEPSLARVLKGYNLLQKHKVNTEILCVLNSHNVKYPLIIYDFFKQMEAGFITFLPLVITAMESPSQVTPDSVSAEEFGQFLIKVFDKWVEEDIGKIKIQIFEEAARTAFNQEHTLCIFKPSCGGVPVVEHNGDFYSCDHYVDNEHFLGNIMNKSIVYFLDSPSQKAFGQAKSITLPKYCFECPVKEMCNGECPKNRFIKTPDGEPGLNYLCQGYKLFFTHCQPFVEALKLTWQNQDEAK
jgi:uncharacterized protein